MWFKNLRIYRFTEMPTVSAEQLHESLKDRPFLPCGSHDEFSFGFVNPVKDDSESTVFFAGQYVEICGKKEERILPSSAINEELAKRIKEIEEREARKLPTKERSRMKDELIFELLPRALTKSTKTHAYIDTENGFLIVDSSSAKKAEDLLSQLRKCLGSLPVTPLQVENKPHSVMTQWLTFTEANHHQNFTLDDECELRSPEEGGSIIRCKRQDLSLPEIKNHLDNGLQVHKLALTWNDRISFTLDVDLAIKRVKFLDLVQEKAADIEAFDEAEQFEADFTIMTSEITVMLDDLIEAFGGMPTCQA